MPSLFPTDDVKWNAVTQRDPLADGQFLYAVETTGVFCRPVCTSRRPNRKNVKFFESTEQAEEAGFRACKRCRPGVAHEVDPQVAIILRACEAIATAEETLSLNDLAEAAGLSQTHFHRLFKRFTGVTPKQYSDALRRERVQRGLTEGESVTRAIYGAGYGSSSRFYERSDETLGMTPSEYRDGAPSQSIRFATAKTSLGWLLVAVTERGICAVELGDSKREMEANLRERFPKAERISGDEAFDQLLCDVVQAVEDPSVGKELPLDLRGTAFQQRVWDALRRIPAGETVTYSDIAGEIGKPTAVRAVASACAANKIAVLVPCHRALRRDGKLGGYRWGLKRKEKLLQRESGDEGSSD